MNVLTLHPGRQDDSDEWRGVDRRRSVFCSFCSANLCEPDYQACEQLLAASIGLPNGTVDWVYYHRFDFLFVEALVNYYASIGHVDPVDRPKCSHSVVRSGDAEVYLAAVFVEDVAKDWRAVKKWTRKTWGRRAEADTAARAEAAGMPYTPPSEWS